MNKLIFNLFFIFFINALPISSLPALTETIECSKELLLAYYPEEFVKITLEKYNIPKEHWDAIAKELNERDKLIMKTIEEKASKMNPNPLKEAQQRQIAVKMFRETLLEEFSDVLKAYEVNDQNQIEEMLSDIQKQKAKRFAKCIQRQREAFESKPKSASKSD